jgi:deoxyribodipyrimidine photo-lyase
MRRERIVEANGKAECSGEFVLYWMQASVRAEENLALEWAIDKANERNIPLVVLFCIVQDYPSASPSHYRYLLGGLSEAKKGLAEKGMRLAVSRDPPAEAVGALADRTAVIVTDCGYTRIQRKWLQEVADAASCRVVRVEGNLVVPAACASTKEEWSAFTLRRRIWPLIDAFLDASDEKTPRCSSFGVSLPPSFAADIDGLIAAPPGAAAGRSIETRLAENPGFGAARDSFAAFLQHHLPEYEEGRNDPNRDATSRMSAALHFGHVSPISLVRWGLAAVGERSVLGSANRDLNAYVEELVVRRELAVNFVVHRDDYDAFSCLPGWAQKTLSEASLHRREALYSFAEFEAGATHDPYWNAAQDEMVLTGRMHGYMRMYWGKQILAWSASPEQAYSTAVTLNDRYSLDGRDPNGYAGVAWCFGKHDRPWAGRPVFGTVRYMNANGLKRKFDADAYVRRIRAMKEASCSTTSNTPMSPGAPKVTTSKSMRSRPAVSAKGRSLS